MVPVFCSTWEKAETADFFVPLPSRYHPIPSRWGKMVVFCGCQPGDYQEKVLNPVSPFRFGPSFTTKSACFTAVGLGKGVVCE